MILSSKPTKKKNVKWFHMTFFNCNGHPLNLEVWISSSFLCQKKKQIENRKVHGVSPLLCPAVNPKVKFYDRYNGTKERNIKKPS